ncbi:unnamed protein product [Owenia fusiformis]|uniref:Uncharacterized protein n=1 Tax=Owenia fusiformis TaxID=6347 RepID=A0A8J1UIU5_OWEFU|nr:unnamed protein product [Owenia fusiformis]
MDVTALGEKTIANGRAYDNHGYTSGDAENGRINPGVSSVVPINGDVILRDDSKNRDIKPTGSALYDDIPVYEQLAQDNIVTIHDTAIETQPNGKTLYTDLEISKENGGIVLETLPRPPAYDDVYKRELLPEPSEECGPCLPCLKCGKLIAKSRGGMGGRLKSAGGWLSKIVLLIMLLGYTCYFIAALVYSVEKARALIVITAIVVTLIFYTFIRNHYGERIYEKIFQPCVSVAQRHSVWLARIVGLLVFIGFVLFLALDVIRSWMQLASLGGMAGFLLLAFITSKHPNHVRLRPIVWGMGLQFVFGVLVLRWKPGYDAIDWIARQVQTFLEYTNDASEVVFGEYLDHPFIFMIMPMLIFFATVLAILHYFGIIQIIVGKMGWFMSFTLGTTAVESISVAANIFLNGLDSIMLVRPYLMSLTKSEFHAIMVGNHATLAGFAFAAFIALGAPARHLLSAAVMSAPAAMAVCKLNYPETEVSCLKTEKDVKLGKATERNMVEAASSAASLAGKTIAAVVVNLVAFIAILAFLNTTIKWFGQRVGYEDWSFQKACSYLLLPIVYLMGVEHADASKVAELLGWKIFASEIIAFAELGNMVDNNMLTERTQVIATYALCGFSSLSTVALSIGVWSAVEPRRINEVTSTVLRVIVNANISCFLTACVAGMLVHVPTSGSGSNVTTTMLPSTTTENPWEEIIDIVDCIFFDNCGTGQGKDLAKTIALSPKGVPMLG